MGVFVFKHWSVAGFVGIACLMQPARSTPIAVHASANVISPADVWAQTATQLLLSPSPGVLTLTIPGSAGSAATSIELAAAGTVGSGSFVFTASSLGAHTTAQIMQMVERASMSLTSSTSLSTELSTRGVLSGQGVQIAVLRTAPGDDGDGALAVIITFD